VVAAADVRPTTAEEGLIGRRAAQYRMSDIDGGNREESQDAEDFTHRLEDHPLQGPVGRHRRWLLLRENALRKVREGL
jgi:hypothetical protein